MGKISKLMELLEHSINFIPKNGPELPKKGEIESVGSKTFIPITQSNDLIILNKEKGIVKLTQSSFER